MVTVDDVKSLRETTGAGVMECKKALAECQGDATQAVKWLQEKGMSKAAKRSSREASEGLVEAYIHNAGRLGVLVEINCETDFVARNEQFKEFAHSIAMHIAAAGPAYITEDEIPVDLLDGLDDAEKNAFLKEKVLFNQGYIRDESTPVGQVVTDLIAKTGENIVIRRFSRFGLGQER